MQKIIHVAINDLRVTFTESGIWVNLVLIPVFLIFILGIANGGSNSGEPQSISVDVIDLDQTEISDQFMTILRQVNPTLRLCPFDNTDDDVCGLDGQSLTPELGRARVEDNETNALITLPQGFAVAVFNGQASVVGYLSSGDPTAVDPLLQSVEATVGRIAGSSVAARVAEAVYTEANTDAGSEAVDEFRSAVYDAAAARWSSPPASVNYNTTGDEGAGSPGGFSQSTPGMGTMYVMFTVLGGTAILLRERHNWTLQRLITMPVSSTQILAGKVLSRFTMGMIQYVVAFGAGLLIGAKLGNSPLGLLLIMVSFTICTTALAFLLAGFVETEQQASSLVTFVVLVAAPLGGAWWPLEIVPDFMKALAYISPIGWAMQGFTEIIFYNGTIADVLLPSAALVAAGVIIFLFSVRRFRYQ